MRKILLVEDEDVLRETFEMMMDFQPYTFDTAENGEVALKLCERHTYDLILVDLMMPVLSGVGFLKRFMLNRPSQTKVIVLSNLSSGSELEEAMSLGADKSVLKSTMSPKELLSLVRYELDAF